MLGFQLDLVRTVQSMRSAPADLFFQAVSAAVSEPVTIVALVWIARRFGSALGARALFLYLVSACINADLKELLRQPRPFDLDASLPHAFGEGYGFPSGHAQTTVVAWGWLLRRFRAGTAAVAAVVAGGVLVGLSRVYLGVHFPTDVLGGWGIGALVLAAYAAVEPMVSARLAGWSSARRLALALCAPAAVALLYPTSGAIRTMGLFAGIAVGTEAGKADPGPRNANRVLVGAGVLCFLLAYFAIRYLAPDQPAALVEPLRFVAYAVLGFGALRLGTA
jgi:membrane-associated phospholipid phosphatase